MGEKNGRKLEDEGKFKGYRVEELKRDSSSKSRSMAQNTSTAQADASQERTRKNKVGLLRSE